MGLSSWYSWYFVGDQPTVDTSRTKLSQTYILIHIQAQKCIHTSIEVTYNYFLFLTSTALCCLTNNNEHCICSSVDTATRILAGQQRIVFDFWQGQEIFLFSATYKTSSWTHPTTNPTGIRVCFPGMKQPEQEADLPFPSSVEDKNTWNSISILSIHLFAWCFFMLGDIFTIHSVSLGKLWMFPFFFLLEFMCSSNCLSVAIWYN